MTHFDEMVGLMYLEGQLDGARATEVAAHIDACASCRALVHALEHETSLVSSALTEDDEAMPARLLAEHTRSVPSWVWTLVFGTLATGVYWLWTDGVVPWFDQLSNAGFGGTDLFSMIVFSGAFWEGWSDMIDAIQIGAVIVAALVAIVWIRRRLQRRTALAVVMTAILAALVIPRPASAAEVRRGRAAVVPAGDVVHNDLIVAGPSVRVDGTVEGDLIAFTRNLTVTGHVTGDVIGFAGETLIDGTVDGNVRVFTHNAILQGSIQKNVTAFANSLDFASKSTIGGGMIAFAGEAELDGKLQRDLLGMIGRTELEGLIGGQAWVRSGSLTVASTADIRGPVTFEGPQQPVVEQGAKLASPIQTEIMQERRRGRHSAARVSVRAIFSYAGALLVGVLLYMLLPGFFRAVLRETGTIAVPIGVGAIALFSAAILLVAGVILLILGIGAGLAGATAYLPAVYLAQIFVGTWLGNRILGAPPEVTSAVAGRMAVGLLILHAARLIPFLGALVSFVVLLWGTGAVLIGFYRVARVEAAPAAA